MLADSEYWRRNEMAEKFTPFQPNNGEEIPKRNVKGMLEYGLAAAYIVQINSRIDPSMALANIDPVHKEKGLAFYSILDLNKAVK